jgi:hypothetical protein
MKIRRRDWLEYLFWIIITFVFLYERRYIFIKFGLGQFVECVMVRLLLIVSLAYGHLYYLLPRFFITKKYTLYIISLLLALFFYVILQSGYDYYLYGFVIGDRARQSFWASFPYNFFTTAWYVALTVALHRALDWYQQHELLHTLQIENEQLKQQATLQTASQSLNGNSILLKSGTKQIKVALEAITHIQGLKDYSIIYTTHDKIVIRGNLKQMEALFPPGRLLRIHKSYFVMSDKIIAIDKNKVVLVKTELPIGRNYKQQVRSLFLNKK